MRSNADLVDSLSTMEIERRKERSSLNEKIKKDKIDAEAIEQANKVKMKEQIKLTQSMKNEYELGKKEDLETIQELEEKNYNLSSKLKNQEDQIRDLEKKLETNRWSEQESTVDTKQKSNRIPKLKPKMDSQYMEVDTSIEPRTRESTRVYDSSSMTSDTDASEGTISKRKREEPTKNKKKEVNYSSENSNRSQTGQFKTPKETIRKYSGSRRKLTDQEEYRVHEKKQEESSVKDLEIKTLKDIMKMKDDQQKETMELLKNENQRLRDAEKARTSVVNPRTGDTTDPNLSTEVSSTENTLPRSVPSTGVNPRTGIYTAQGATASNICSSTGAIPRTGETNSARRDHNNPSTGERSRDRGTTSTGENPNSITSYNPGETQEVSSSHDQGELIRTIIGDFVVDKDGRISINKQTAKWITTIKEKEKGTPTVQLENVYLGEEHPLKREFPMFLDYDWHPLPTKHNLTYSYSGYWVLAPKKKGDLSGPLYDTEDIARVEPYITKEGDTREAVSYGRNTNKMNIWFDLNEVREARGEWLFPEIPYFFNGKVFEYKFRREHKELADKYNHKEEDVPRQGQYQKQWRNEKNMDRNRKKEVQKQRYHSEWDDEDSDRPGRSSGAGRGSRLDKYDQEPRSDYQPRGRRHRNRNSSRERDYSDRSNSRERPRGEGAKRDKKNHYGGRS